MTGDKPKSKSDLRIKYAKLRDETPVYERFAAGEAMCENLFSAAAYKNAASVFCYISMKSETPTSRIFERSRLDGKITAAPVISRRNKTMNFYKITGFDRLRENYYGIMEPDGGELVEPDENSLVIVPGLAFGENFSRVGYGGGYYDAYFKGKSNGVLFGVCYDFQLLPHIEILEYDIVLNGIVTDKRVLINNNPLNSI